MANSIDIAVVGAACRLPGAGNLTELSDVLFAGRDAVGQVPDGRWNKRLFFDPDPHQPGKSYTFAAGCLDAIDQFDAGFFGMSPREAMHTDPQQRLLLELAYEALEESGQRPSRLSGRDMAVFVGGSAWDYATVGVGDISLMDSHSMQGLSLSSLSNRLSYFFNLSGPSLTVDTACSSALVALHLACRAIANGEAGSALVGAVNLLISPQNFVGFSSASMLSPSGRCHAFGVRADGYVRAEGGGVVVLKPLREAIADGDAIRAVIRGVGVNSDGRTSSFSVPGREAQTRLLRSVYREAGIDPDALCYLEAHGTGTPVGDPIEAAALGAGLAKGRNSPLPIGSVKTNIGHLEAASGMAGLMKLLTIFERGAVPPSLHCETPNPNIPFEALNLTLTPKTLPLSMGSDGVVMGINSFGFGGTNAHAILSSAPVKATQKNVRPDVSPPLLISAKTQAALKALADQWSERLKAAPKEEVGLLTRGAARGRDVFSHRLAIASGRPETMANNLDAWLAGDSAAALAAGSAVEGSVALVFSGNGSQWRGMGADAYAHNSVFRHTVAEIDDIFRPLAGWSLCALMLEPPSQADMQRTDIAQPLLFAVQVATTVALRAAGIVGQSVIGHSAGEVAAAWACGALTLSQATTVIFHRSHLQQSTHGQGGMAALGLGEKAALALIEVAAPELEIAAINSADAVTVAGPMDALLRLQTAARAKGRGFLRLPLDYAFHSTAMDSLQGPIRAALDGLTSEAPTILMLSTTTGTVVSPKELGADYWWRNVRSPVLFASGVEQLIDRGARIFLEIGPRPILQSHLQSLLKAAGASGAVLDTLRETPYGDDPFATIGARCHVAGADITAAPVFDGPAAMRGLPTYPWQRERHWFGSTVERVELNSPIEDHPLLGFRRDAAGKQWSSLLSIARMPWLADHSIGGVPVLPAAAMMDMALAAARARQPNAGAFEIVDFEVLRPVLVEGVRELCFEMVTGETFELSSRPRLSPEARVVYARGRMAPEPGPGALFRPRKPDAPYRELTPEAFYERVGGIEIDYGPQFRPIQRARIYGPDEVEVAFSPVSKRSAFDRGWLLDPCLLDGALQSLFATRSLDYTLAGDSLLPWRFDRVRLLRPELAPALAACRLTRIGPKAHCADIAVMAANGEIIAELLQCWFVRVRPGESARVDRAFWRALVPCQGQPNLKIAATAAPTEMRLAEPASSELLAQAYATALAHQTISALAQEGRICDETLRLHPDSRPMIEVLLAWLTEDGLAQAQGSDWRITAESGLPEPSQIWQTLLLDDPGAVAEIALIGMAGESLSQALSDGPQALEGSIVLRQQMLEASPTAAAGRREMASRLQAFLSAWPVGRPLRLAILGQLSSALIREVLAQIDARKIDLRLAVIGEGLSPTIAAELRRRPGVVLLAQSPSADSNSLHDLILGAYGLSLGRITPEAILARLAAAGTAMLIEAEPSRAWDLTNGLGAPAQDWAGQMARAGLVSSMTAPITGAVWPAVLITGQAAPATDSDVRSTDLAVFVDGKSRLARALGNQRNTPPRPLSDLANCLRQTRDDERDIVLLLSDDADTLTLAKFCGQVARLARLVASAERTRLWLTVQALEMEGAVQALSALRRVMTNEGLDVRFLHVEPGVSAAQILAEISGADEEREILLGPNGRRAPRLRLGLPARAKLSGPRRLEIARPGVLGALAWQPFDPPNPGPGQVAVAVKASGLNFRDVMWALGALPDEALMDGFSGPTLGLECAGEVIALGEGVTGLSIGDRVAALAPSALATQVVTAATAVLPIPAEMDFAAAATLPVTAMTTIYAMGVLARLGRGERVLIHGALGGVGLAAIQYARHLGAEIYATAGSPARRSLLRAMGVTHVFDSRTPNFGDEILRATGGEGVDVVLNSLSGTLMQQSLRLLRPFGRFIEIGKRDLFANSEIGLRPLRHNATYFAVDVDQLPLLRPQIAAEVLGEATTLVAAGILRPLPYLAFDDADVVDAFRLMQGSGHVGKIIVRPPQHDPTKTVSAAPRFTVRADRTYVVTGGTAGFGLETARWLADRGARSLALLSRSGLGAAGIEEALRDFASRGVNARVYGCDVAQEAQLACALAEIRNDGPPIGGVVHAAMVMDDGLLSDLSAERFEASLRPKLDGAQALDQLTRADPIELFVLYSSISAAIGNPGQGNYVVANAAMEAVALRRAAAGLPALAVQWGPISDAGFLVRETRVRELLERVLASGEMTARSALDALPAMFESGLPVVGYAAADWSVLKRQLPIGATPLLAETIEDESGKANETSIREQILQLGAQEAQALVEEFLMDEVSTILRLDRASVEVDLPISKMGFDSLMTLELHLAVESRLRCELPIMSVGGGASLRSIAARVVRGIRQDEAPDSNEGLEDRLFRHEVIESIDDSETLEPGE